MFSRATNSTIHGGTFQSAGNIINFNSPQIFQRGMWIFSGRTEHEISIFGPGLDILHEHVAVGAFHNSAERFDPAKCYPRTREAIIAKIEAWVKECPENGNRLVFWMYGPAGAGKSAIAQSIAELCEAFLAASFFFSRTSPGRSDNSRLVATIVWQLIRVIPEIREIVLSALAHDPTLLSQTPATQMKALIVDPMNQVPMEVLTNRSRLVILDGLDECLPPKSQDDILNILSTSLQHLETPLYFLITSRPHSNIRHAFSSNAFRSTMHTLPLEHDYQSTNDIRRYLTSNFEEIRGKHVYLPSSWPKPHDVEVLVEKSSGQFIYAATVIRYITRGPHGHEKRLDVVLKLRSPDNSVTPFAMLDALYIQIFRSVGQDEIEKVMEVLGALIFLKENIDKLEVLEEFFSYRPGELASIMGDMPALVHIPDSRSESIKIYHASLPDFLLDPTRSQVFYLHAAAVYLNLARHCIKDRLHNFEDGSPQYQWYTYPRVFSECIFASPFTVKLSDFLVTSSIWDSLPVRLEPFLDITIGRICIELLKNLQVGICLLYLYIFGLRNLFFSRTKVPKSMKRSYAPLIGAYLKHFHQFHKTFSQWSSPLLMSMSSLLNSHHTKFKFIDSPIFYQS